MELYALRSIPRLFWVSAHNVSSTNVVPFVISITIYLRRISCQRFKLLKCWKLKHNVSFTIYNYTYVWLGKNKAYLWIKGKSKFLHIINESLVFFISFTWAVTHKKYKHNWLYDFMSVNKSLKIYSDIRQKRFAYCKYYIWTLIHLHPAVGNTLYFIQLGRCSWICD